MLDWIHIMKFILNAMDEHNPGWPGSGPFMGLGCTIRLVEFLERLKNKNKKSNWVGLVWVSPFSFTTHTVTLI